MAFAQDPVPQQGKKFHIPSLRLAIPEDFCKINGPFFFFYFTSSPPTPFMFYKRTWHLDHNKMVILRY